MDRLFRGLVASACGALAGCATVQPFDPSTDKLEQSDLALSTATFQEVCVDSLPDLSQADARATARGFEPLGIPGQGQFGARTYRTNLKSVVALTLRPNDSAPLCGVAFLGPDARGEVQDAFLDVTTRRLGGAPRARLRASETEAAYHLPNQSAMIFEARPKGDGTSHYVYLSPPLPREEAQRLVAD